MHLKELAYMAQISIRIDDDLRRKTEEILGELGLNMSAAVNILARQIVRTRGIPFPLTLADEIKPNRHEAAAAFVAFAASHPVELGQGYKFNRDECYDNE
jgi:addiction module RelB/DinJ family antitoxin